MLLYDVEPLQHRGLELIISLLLRLVLHVEHGRQVAVLQFHLAHEMLGLTVGGRVYAEEVVGSADDAVLAGFVEVVVEVGVELVGTFGGLDEDKTDGCALYVGVAHLFPVDVLLVVADVDAADGAGRVVGVAVDGFPAEGVGTDEGFVEEDDVNHDDKNE